MAFTRRFTRRRFQRPTAGFRTRGQNRVTQRNAFLNQTSMFTDQVAFEDVLTSPADWQVQGVDVYRSVATITHVIYRVAYMVNFGISVTDEFNGVQWYWNLYVIDEDDTTPVTAGIQLTAAWRNKTKILREGVMGAGVRIVNVAAETSSTAMWQRAMNLTVNVKGPIKIGANDLLIFGATAITPDVSGNMSIVRSAFSTVRIAIP